MRAVATAGLDSESTFYALLHSYISRSAEAGMPLTVLAENCSTSVRMVEQIYAKVLADKRRESIASGAPRLFEVKNSSHLYDQQSYNVRQRILLIEIVIGWF